MEDATADATADATEILYNDNNFVKAAADFDTSIAEEERVANAVRCRVLMFVRQTDQPTRLNSHTTSCHS